MLISNLKKIEKSQTLLINEQSRNLEQSGIEVIKFGFGQSPFLPPHHVIEKLKENAHLKAYAPVQGLPELRAKVAEFHNKIDGLNASADDIFIAPGSKILIYSILASFENADVLVPAPAWVSYIPQSYLCGHNVISLETDFESRWRITPAHIEDAAKNKKYKNSPTVLILNYPGNPDGLTYSASELEALAQSFKKHNVLVISDEIYSLLHHEGKHVSLAKYYPEGTIITTGLSKWAGAGGWRLGVAIMPKDISAEFKETMLGIASETYSCATLPVQMAAIEAYNYDDRIKNYVEAQRKILKILGTYCFETLNAAKIRVHKPEGAFYVFIDFENHRQKLSEKGIKTSNQLCTSLLKDIGVALLPGTAFGMAESSLTARLAYVEFDGEEAFKEILSQNGAETLILNSGNKVKKGIDLISRWIS